MQKKRTRHDYMLYVIKDRVDNTTYTSKNTFQNIHSMGYSRRKIGFNIDDIWKPKVFLHAVLQVQHQHLCCKNRIEQNSLVGMLKKDY
jgi:hypothetical protein